MRRLRLLPPAPPAAVATTPLVHGADERIDVRDLALATELFADLAVRLLG